MADVTIDEGIFPLQILTWNGARPEWRSLVELLKGTTDELYVATDDDGTTRVYFFETIRPSFVSCQFLEIHGDDLAAFHMTMGAMTLDNYGEGLLWNQDTHVVGISGPGSDGDFMQSRGTGMLPEFVADLLSRNGLDFTVGKAPGFDGGLILQAYGGAHKIIVGDAEIDFFIDGAFAGIIDGGRWTTSGGWTASARPIHSGGADLEGEGYPAIRKQIALSAQTATIGSTSIGGTADNALYRVTMYLQCTTAGSAGTVSASIAWNDGVARSDGTGNINLNGTNQISKTIVCYVTNSTAITYSTTVTGATGSPQYRLVIAAEKITV